MTKLLPLALHTACAAAFALLASGAGAQTSPPGRTAFDHSGCRACHAYSARRGAPSVRDLLVTFEGEPEKALKAIDQNEKHAADLMSGNISEKDLKSIAEWISGAAFPDPEETVIAPVPPTVAAVPVVTPPTPTTEIPAVPATAAAPIVKPAPPPPTRLAATGTVSRIAIEPGKKSDRLFINLTGKEPDELDIKSVDGKLLISLPGIALAEGVPATLASTKDSRAVGTVQSSDADGTLRITVTVRSGDLKYFASQGKHRLTIELTAIPAKKKPASAPLVAAAPTAPAIVPAPTAIAPSKAPGKAATAAKLTSAATAPSEKAAPIAKTVPPTTPAAAKPEPKAAALDNAKARQDAKAEADAKARKDAEAQALAKKEADAKAKKDTEIKAAQANAKKESDTKAKQESTDAARKEAEMLASLKASAEALKGGGMSGMSASEASGGRRDRSKLKAPDKFRDEPCPPIAESDPIGNVDEARAKDIIERVGCPQCHAFVAKKTGPPFKKVFEKVKGNPSCVIKKLKTNKEHKEEGVTDDLKGPEFKIIADYIASRAK